MADARPKTRRWVSQVKTVSTYPPQSLFTRDAGTIARVMASPRVSPKGLGSGIRMIQFFINRAGRALSPARKRELERAKRLLQERATRQRPAPRRGAKTRLRRPKGQSVATRKSSARSR